jgi:hypothetical protein
LLHSPKNDSTDSSGRSWQHLRAEQKDHRFFEGRELASSPPRYRAKLSPGPRVQLPARECRALTQAESRQTIRMREKTPILQALWRSSQTRMPGDASSRGPERIWPSLLLLSRKPDARIPEDFDGGGLFEAPDLDDARRAVRWRPSKLGVPKSWIGIYGRPCSDPEPTIDRGAPSSLTRGPARAPRASGHFCGDSDHFKRRFKTIVERLGSTNMRRAGAHWPAISRAISTTMATSAHPVVNRSSARKRDIQTISACLLIRMRVRRRL